MGWDEVKLYDINVIFLCTFNTLIDGIFINVFTFRLYIWFGLPSFSLLILFDVDLI